MDGHVMKKLHEKHPRHPLLYVISLPFPSHLHDMKRQINNEHVSFHVHLIYYLKIIKFKLTINNDELQGTIW
jgi:hypothetical protein